MRAMLKSLLKYWCILLLLGLTMFASALYLPSSHLSSSSSSPSSLPSSRTVHQFPRSTFSLSKSSSMSLGLAKGLPPTLPRQRRSAKDVSSPEVQEPFFSSSSSSSSSSLWSPKGSSLVSSPLLLSSPSSSSSSSSSSSHRGLRRGRREAKATGSRRTRSRRVKRSQRVKRSRRLWSNFYKVMASHRRYRTEQAFVERLFKHFDMNRDQVIERDEFKAVLQLLGVISKL